MRTFAERAFSKFTTAKEQTQDEPDTNKRDARMYLEGGRDGTYGLP